MGQKTNETSSQNYDTLQLDSIWYKSPSRRLLFINFKAKLALLSK